MAKAMGIENADKPEDFITALVTYGISEFTGTQYLNEIIPPFVFLKDAITGAGPGDIGLTVQ